MMTPGTFLSTGVDLGQSRDPTAIAIVEKHDQTAWHDGSALPCHLHLRHLERLPLGEPYPSQVSHVQKLVSRIRTDLVVDATGVGRPIVDLFRQGGLILTAVTITAGDAVTIEKVKGGENVRLSKLELISTLNSLLHSERLKIAPSLPLAKTLVAEFFSFEVRASAATGRETFGAREGQHDDLVLAVALACWHALRPPPRRGKITSKQTLIPDL